jgi:hypothetical protein
MMVFELLFLEQSLDIPLYKPLDLRCACVIW